MTRSDVLKVAGIGCGEDCAYVEEFANAITDEMLALFAHMQQKRAEVQSRMIEETMHEQERHATPDDVFVFLAKFGHVNLSKPFRHNAGARRRSKRRILQ